MHYRMAQTTSVMTVPFLPILFPMMDSVEYKILDQKTAEFGGNIIWFFILAIIIDGTKVSFQSWECG